MTSRELEILNTIEQLGGQASRRAISKKTGLSLDYSQVLSQALLRQHLLARTARQLFALTVQGRLAIERRERVGETAGLDLAEVSRLINKCSINSK